MTVKSKITLSLLQTVALTVAGAGAAGSVGLTLYAGRNNSSLLLPLLFVLWVLSPFVGLLIAHIVSKRWSFTARRTLYLLMLILPPFSLLSYSGIFSVIAAKPAFVFLMVPLLSWLLMAIAISLAIFLSRKV